MNGQWRQVRERRFDGRGVGGNKSLSERWTDVASTGDTDRRQMKKSALFEFVDHASGGKGFQLPGMGLPSPVTANMLGYFMAAPVRVLYNQMAYPAKIRLGDATTLTCNRFIHGPDYAMGEVVSPEKTGYRKLT